MKASISLQKHTGFAKGGQASYRRSLEERAVTAEEKEDLVVPVLLADSTEQEALGVREVFLRWKIRGLAPSSPVAYGRIQVTADIPRADILLDGHPVGRTADGKQSVLEAIVEGDHEVGLRDLSGREVSKTVRVARDRTVEVVLSLLASAPAAPLGGLVPLGANPQAHEEYWRERDGALVVGIPGGPFQMGSPNGQGQPSEHPLHEVYVTDFLMDKTEVTWGQFQRFSVATGTTLPKPPLWGTPDDYPVTSATWDRAAAFCEWVGGRLPTEAEWEKAARGHDTRQYPWGDDWDPNRCNTYVGGPHRPLAVGVFPGCVSPYGVLDMAGSAWEWCDDWYDEHYYEVSPRNDPRGPSSGHMRVTRGGDWLHQPSWTRVSLRYRAYPTSENVRQGFRCVQSAPSTGAMSGATGNGAKPKLDGTGEGDGVGRPASRDLKMDLIVTGTPSAAREGDRCAVAAPVESARKKDWWISFGEARSGEERGRMIARSRIRCGLGAFADARVPGADASAFPLLIWELSTTMVRKPGPVPETETTLAVSSRKLSGFSEGGKPTYDSSRQTRILKLEESGEAVLPIFIPSAEEKDALGVHDILLRLRLARSGAGTAPGVVSLETDAPEATVFLDGGVVGRTNDQGALTLRNVPAGERELRARATTGRVARRIVDVVPDRTVLVDLQLSPARPSRLHGNLVYVGESSRGHREYRRESDGAVMVQIPAGGFIMGNAATEGQPLPHEVHVSKFLIDKTPVTWGQYKRFGQKTGRPIPPEPYWGFRDDHPAVFVTWEEARAYCEWVGGRLPTEAEREKSCRGTDGRKYPWGEDEPSPERAVFQRTWGYPATEPAGAHPAGASPYGVLDAGGNVWEWCADWYDPAYYQVSPARDPRGPRAGRARVVRGGSWDSRPSVLSCSARNFGYVGYREGDFGFRCAGDAPP